jgi:hypothetical protein
MSQGRTKKCTVMPVMGLTSGFSVMGMSVTLKVAEHVQEVISTVKWMGLMVMLSPKLLKTSPLKIGTAEPIDRTKRI